MSSGDLFDSACLGKKIQQPVGIFFLLTPSKSKEAIKAGAKTFYERPIGLCPPHVFQL